MTRRPDGDTPMSEGWILDEDWALRQKLRGVMVSDQGEPRRSVGVWFGHPDTEIREQKYPYITIDLIGIEENRERVHRGHLYIGEGHQQKPIPKWWGLDDDAVAAGGVRLEMPTPVDLFYQIGTWSRNPRHDRQMLDQMINGGRTLLRGGTLRTPDGYIRRMDWHGHTKRDIADENGKRLFNNVFRILVSSEIPYDPNDALYWRQAKSVLIRYNDMSDGYDESSIIYPDPESD